MPVEIGTGDGETVIISEPTRATFDDNLGGAVQFAFANALYKIMETMGASLGAFAAGVAVQFMERVEPSLVEYSRPLIDMLLEQPELPGHLRDFFTALREPTHEGAAAILGGLSSQVGGAVMGNVLAPILAPLTYALNKSTRNALMGVTEIVTAYRRGSMSAEDMRNGLAMHGFTDQAIGWLLEVSKSKAGVGDLLTGLYRETLTTENYMGKMREHGFDEDEILLFMQNARQQLGVGEVVNAWFRKELDDGEIRNRLSKLGYNSEDIGLILETAPPIPGAGDLVRMGLREAFRDDIAAEWSYDEDFPPQLAYWMERQGYDPQWATYYWRAHWSLPSLSQGFEMFQRRVIDHETLQILLRVSDIPQFWREKLTAISYNPLTRVDVRRMYGLGVLDRDGVYESYLDTGYSPENAEAMTEFTLLYENPDGSSKLDDYKELTRSVITQGYRKGVISRDQAVTRLMSIGYLTEDINILLSIADWQRDIADAPDYMDEYQRDVKSIIEKAYAARIMSETDAKEGLTGAGYSDTEATFIISSVDFWYGLDQTMEELKVVGEVYIRRGINRSDVMSKLGALGLPSEMMTQKLAEWDTQRSIRSRRLTEAQYRKAFQGDLFPVDEYQENLRGLGYTEYDIWILTALAAGTEVAGAKPQEGPLS